MAKNERTSTIVRSKGSRQTVLTDSVRSGQATEKAAASALRLRASSGSVRVIKDVSAEHRDALKRLVDR